MIYTITEMAIALLDACALLLALSIFLKPKFRPVLSHCGVGSAYAILLIFLDETKTDANVKISICIIAALAFSFLLFSGNKGNIVLSCALYFAIAITVQMLALLISILVIGENNAIRTSDSMIWLPVLVDVVVLLAIIAIRANFRAIPGNLPTIYTLTITVLLLVEIVQIAYLMKDYVDTRNEVIKLDTFSMTTSIFIIISGIASLFLLRHSLYSAVNQRIGKMHAKQYRDMQSSFDAIRKRIHDDKHIINLALCYSESGEHGKLRELLGNMREEIYESAKILYTNNALIDGILNSKAAFAQSRGIIFRLEIENGIVIPISDIDFYILFGNALDNAIEANLRGSGDSCKHVHVAMRQNNRGLCIDITNPIFDGIDERFKTSKADSENHGYGLKNMKSIIKKYDGILDISADEFTFALRVFLPVRNL